VALALYGRIVLPLKILFYRRFGSKTWSMALKPANVQALLHAGTAARPRFERWRRRVDLFRAELCTPVGPREKLRALLQGSQCACHRLIAGMAGTRQSPSRLP
jgi:hypothetical protein